MAWVITDHAFSIVSHFPQPSSVGIFHAKNQEKIINSSLD
jgi:hypothetical protein